MLGRYVREGHSVLKKDSELKSIKRDHVEPLAYSRTRGWTRKIRESGLET